MKKLSAITFNTAKSNILLTIAFAATVLFAGCNKDTTSTNNTTSGIITTDDMTQAVTNAVSGSTSGLAAQTETTTQIAYATSLACGTTSDSTISGASPSGALLAYSYDLNFSRACVCAGGVPSQYNTTITGSSSYSVILMSSVDSTNAQITVSGVQASSANYVLNETYTRKGTQQSLIGSQHSFNSTLTITSNNINVAKSTMQIVSGTATVQFNGTDLAGAAFSGTATITFLGNNQATLIVNNGSPSTISW